MLTETSYHRLAQVVALLTTLLMLPVADCLAASRPNADSLYVCLDEAIADVDKFVARREGDIQHLRNRFEAAEANSTRYTLAMEMYRQFMSYKSDSTLVWLDRAEAIARRGAYNAGVHHCRALKAYQCSTTGMYNEADDILASVDKSALDADGIVDYYKAAAHLYGELAYYTKIDSLRRKWNALAQAYSDTLLAVAPPNSDISLQLLEVRAYNAGDYAGALRYNDIRMKNVAKGSHGMAIVAYYRFLDHKMLGNTAEWTHWLAMSALCDVRNAVMDQAAVWELANTLYTNGDIERSYRYINFASDCASVFSTRLRNQQIAPVMQVVDKVYHMHNRRQNNYLKLAIVISVVFIIFSLLFVFYLVRQRRRLANAQAKLSQKNQQLTNLNTEMRQTLDNLDTLNKRLVATGDNLNVAVAGLDESNRVKEKYIGLFLRQCSLYIDRMDTQRRDTLSMLKSKRYTELYELVKNHNSRDRDREELFEIFDSSFIRLFPTFVDEFNMLLKPEHRIALPDQSKLTPAIRIFALIRLGIDDSSKIAEFLHFSVNTIYNYRAKTKNGAAVDRDEFEDLVRAIGKPVTPPPPETDVATVDVPLPQTPQG